MSMVASARHLQLDTTVAIKFLLPSEAQSDQAVARFVHEARTGVRLTSEHVARVFDVDRLENGAPYIVMEYLEGLDLGQWLETRGPLIPARAADFLLQACEALAEAHQLGIVHRDLKPANLFCTRRQSGFLFIKVLDFGISKIPPSSESHLQMTRVGDLVGSPAYMSPEQLDSPCDVDARTDIWALGVILYELLTGELPFLAESVPRLCVKIATEDHTPVRSSLPQTPPGFDAVIARCLKKNRDERYPNLVAFVLGLAELAPPHAEQSVVRVLRTMDAAGLSSGKIRVASPVRDEGRRGGSSGHR